MQLSRLQLRQFRSHDDATFEFDPNVTAIIGPNGSGKTNILEAIYTLCMGRSFRDADDELISYEQDWYRINGIIDGIDRDIRYQPGSKGKQLSIDGTSKGRFTYRQQLPVVLFEPDDLLMIHASPSARRSYLDTLLIKLSPLYRQQLSRYERTLMQRNNLLKQHMSLHELKDSLFVWDVGLADLGAKIIAARTALISRVNEFTSAVYSDIAGKEHTLRMTYLHPGQHISETQLAAALAGHLDHDVRRGFTTVGPHRHDIELLLDGKSSKVTASRGEVRTIVLALKQIEIRLIERAIGSSPLLLLDDVFSELDTVRKKRVTMSPDVQTIMTTTDLARVKGITSINLA